MPSRRLWALSSILLSLQGHAMNRKKGAYWLVGQLARLDRKSQMALGRQNHVVYCQDVSSI